MSEKDSEEGGGLIHGNFETRKIAEPDQNSGDLILVDFSTGKIIKPAKNTGDEAEFDLFGKPETLLRRIQKKLSSIQENIAAGAIFQDTDKISFAGAMIPIQSKVEDILKATKDCSLASLELTLDEVSGYSDYEIIEQIHRSAFFDWCQEPPYYRALCIIAQERAERSPDPDPDPSDDLPPRSA